MLEILIYEKTCYLFVTHLLVLGYDRNWPFVIRLVIGVFVLKILIYEKICYLFVTHLFVLGYERNCPFVILFEMNTLT